MTDTDADVGASGRATHEPSQQAVSALRVGIPDALPEYGEWVPDVWEAYLLELTGWEYRNGWAHLPATFRWHEFYERLAQAIEARRAETSGSACESAVPEGNAP